MIKEKFASFVESAFASIKIAPIADTYSPVVISVVVCHNVVNMCCRGKKMLWFYYLNNVSLNTTRAVFIDVLGICFGG